VHPSDATAEVNAVGTNMRETLSLRIRIGIATVIITGFALHISGSMPGPPQRDRTTLESIEPQWLDSEHDPAVLDRILAEDFLHPVSAGVVLTKRQHIDWAISHPPPLGHHQRFDQLQVRTYGSVGIVTGMVVSTDDSQREGRTIFTDVFIRRNKRWQAVSAQETAVGKRLAHRKPPSRPPPIR
jgi:hypothetical protein